MLDCGKPVMEQPFNYFTGKILCNEPLWLGGGGHNASLKKMVSLQYQDISTKPWPVLFLPGPGQ